MTVSRAERRREAKQREQTAGKMSAPLLARLRPITLADMTSGRSYSPGTCVLCVGTMPMYPSEGPAASRCFVVYLPPDRRANTPENAKFALELLKQMNPDVKKVLEELQRAARNPKSRRAAIMTTRHLPEMQIERPAPVAAEPAQKMKDSRREHLKYKP